ncbi:MAG: hypothetical protein HZA83_00985, partial [Thaumarchaeota archaeon]|nr:hypothetical protein [Nitrososphaerota archaeon]
LSNLAKGRDRVTTASAIGATGASIEDLFADAAATGKEVLEQAVKQLIPALGEFFGNENVTVSPAVREGNNAVMRFVCTPDQDTLDRILPTVVQDGQIIYPGFAELNRAVADLEGSSFTAAQQGNQLIFTVSVPLQPKREALTLEEIQQKLMEAAIYYLEQLTIVVPTGVTFEFMAEEGARQFERVRFRVERFSTGRANQSDIYTDSMREDWKAFVFEQMDRSRIRTGEVTVHVRDGATDTDDLLTTALLPLIGSKGRYFEDLIKKQLRKEYNAYLDEDKQSLTAGSSVQTELGEQPEEWVQGFVEAAKGADISVLGDDNRDYGPLPELIRQRFQQVTAVPSCQDGDVLATVNTEQDYARKVSRWGDSYEQVTFWRVSVAAEGKVITQELAFNFPQQGEVTMPLSQPEESVSLTPELLSVNTFYKIAMSFAVSPEQQEAASAGGKASTLRPRTKDEVAIVIEGDNVLEGIEVAAELAIRGYQSINVYDVAAALEVKKRDDVTIGLVVYCSNKVNVADLRLGFPDVSVMNLEEFKTAAEATGTDL